MTNDSVIRYVATYVHNHGMRTLMTSAQGRYTYATADEAQAWIDAVRKNNDQDTLIALWGADTFEVRPCECWPGHFDPKGVWFE